MQLGGGGSIGSVPDAVGSFGPSNKKESERKKNKRTDGVLCCDGKKVYNASCETIYGPAHGRTLHTHRAKMTHHFFFFLHPPCPPTFLPPSRKDLTSRDICTTQFTVRLLSSSVLAKPTKPKKLDPGRQRSIRHECQGGAQKCLTRQLLIM